MHRIPCALFAALALAGCQSRPVAACMETVDVLADAFERCGETTPRADLEAEIEAGATMRMGCRAVVGIRDERALRRECFPALEVIDCATLTGGSVPEACRAQILVRVD